MDLGSATAAVQGFGNAGSVAAALLSKEYDVTIIAVSDSRSAVYGPGGIDVEKALSHKREVGTLSGLPGTEDISNRDLLELECDVLIPAALENQITIDNASRVQARIIAEAANGPTTPEADQVLSENGRMVIPDILANAGGVTVSYFEWVQAKQAYFWTAQDIDLRLRRIMTTSFRDVLATAKQEGIDMRSAAYLLAVDRVAKATQMRGLYP
jgi:glutamate dehydrogenase (NAD(P)+)